MTFHPFLSALVTKILDFSSPSIYPDKYYGVEMIRRGVQSYRAGHRLALMSAVGLYRELYASDPRDIVFALIGISSTAKQRPEDQLLVDYRLSAKEIFRATALHILKQERNLDVISLAAGESVTQGLPSWVPDFTSRSKYPRPLYKPYPFDFTCTLSSKADMTVSQDQNSITVSGIVTDTIYRVGETYDSFENSAVLIHRRSLY